MKRAGGLVGAVCAVFLIAAVADPLEASAAETPEGFSALFDGKTFEGWEGNLEVFRIDDGAIAGGSLAARVKHNEFLCTKREFGDFELRLEAKLVGEGKNAGIQFRSKRVPDHFEVSGFQADMGLFGKDNIWGALYDESRRNKFLAIPDQAAISKAVKAEDWNAFTIRCEGPRIRIWVNGTLATDYAEADAAIPRSGVIGLQIHGGPPAEARYRNIWIKELDKPER